MKLVVRRGLKWNIENEYWTERVFTCRFSSGQPSDPQDRSFWPQEHVQNRDMLRLTRIVLWLTFNFRPFTLTKFVQILQNVSSFETNFSLFFFNNHVNNLYDFILSSTQNASLKICNDRMRKQYFQRKQNHMYKNNNNTVFSLFCHTIEYSCREQNLSYSIAETRINASNIYNFTYGLNCFHLL